VLLSSRKTARLSGKLLQSWRRSRSTHIFSSAIVDREALPAFVPPNRMSVIYCGDCALLHTAGSEIKVPNPPASQLGDNAMRSMWYAVTVAAFMTLPLHSGFAEKLVDPTKVAPEYRMAAEKRRAEQIRELECSHKADAAKVLPRDRTAHIQHCLDEQ
jgi:hypothetical protein